MKKISMFEAQTRSYNLDCRYVQLAGSNANLMGCVLAPGEQSEGHNHLEQEIFIFTDGIGRVETGGHVVDVGPGDAVLFEGFENHIITNTSGDAPLRFHSIYWEGGARTSTQTDDTERDLLIFSTPPTPNGDLHLGHLSGPYLAADVLRRVAARSGRKARHVTGRDDHQTYVETCARREGMNSMQCADHYAAAIRATWQSFGIPLNGFIEPKADAAYADFVKAGLRRLHERGLIKEITAPAYFEPSGIQAHEAHISGACPHCNESSDGNACEACGRPNHCVDLGGAKSKTGAPLEIREHKQLVFRLSSFADQLGQYVKTANMPAHALALSLRMIRDGLPDIAISHRSDWGIRHDLAGFEDQVVYVWFEMAFGYLWAAGADKGGSFDDQIARAALTYNNGDVTHCYGFDNAYYHTLLFPAVYMALGLTPPSTHIVNELLDLDGAKFSTSRRHLIWGRDLIRSVPLDYARYMLMSRRPEGRRENFVPKAAITEINSIFAEKLNRIIERFAEIAKVMDGKSCEPGAWLPDQRRFFAFLQRQDLAQQDAASADGFSPRRLAANIREIIEECEAFQATQSCLFADASTFNYARTAQALTGLALTLVARAADPIMPELAAQLSRLLELKEAELAIHATATFMPSGRQLALDNLLVLPHLDESVAEHIMPKFDGAATMALAS
ncbi:class I tRNA ligase family protein [Rhizobium helianthi]|uniref:Class I tRNA ligase family protein n=1 Tax=Rhizobium helianthi TaxID=1132695 RepID=A0ABW4M7C9_9HYPH